MMIMKDLKDCVGHLTSYKLLSIEQYNTLAKYIEDHKYFLEREWKKSISWDESYNNFREYVYSPIATSIWRKKLTKVLNKDSTEVFLYYISLAQSISSRSIGNWFTPEPELVCDYILWKYYYERREVRRSLFDRFMCWLYARKVRSLRRDSGE